MYVFDGKLEPEWNSNIRFSTVIVAIMSVFRLALRAIIETCISQGAWIWVSTFRKGNVEARLEDFKMFDEAATGIWGSLVLLWRMKGRHLACVGAVISILVQGFETFSSEMVGFNEETTPIALPIPPHPRAETWHNIIPRGAVGDMTLGLSTKTAIYSGIIADTMQPLLGPCPTGHCTWPLFPTLGVSGSCTELLYNTTCDEQNECTYTMPSGTSIYDQGGVDSDFKFIVTPSNGWDGARDAIRFNHPATFSIFDMMSVSRLPSGTKVQAHECALWFCLENFIVEITNGIPNGGIIEYQVETDYSLDSRTSSDELTFAFVWDQTYYTVPEDSIQILKSFMNELMLGNGSGSAGVADYSSVWVEAMHNAASDLDGWIARLTTSMTNDIRQTGSVGTSNVSEYSGTAYTMESHVQVNWYWVIYPLTLMILAFCYLAQTVWRTARDQVCAWKGDSLPMLFCHVDQSICAQVRDGMDVPEGLNDRVGRTEVELVQQDNGQWLFREPGHH